MSRLWTAVVVLVLTGVLMVPATQARKLSATKIFIEINDTDGDAGIHLFLDGEGWEQMKVFDPHGQEIVGFQGTHSVGIQGITELAFESAEPSFEEQPLEDFLALFPEGIYRYEGITTDGKRLKGKARLTHALPDGPVLVAPMDGDTVAPDDLVLEWQAVPNPPGSEIIGYQVIIVREQPSLRTFSADVSPTTTSLTVPPEFLEPGTTYKWEVLAVEASGNQTLSEAEFETE